MNITYNIINKYSGEVVAYGSDINKLILYISKLPEFIREDYKIVEK